MQTRWIGLTSFLALAASGLFSKAIVERPIELLQSEPTELALKMDVHWRALAENRVVTAQLERDFVLSLILRQRQSLQLTGPLPGPSESELKLGSSYQQLPTVHVDTRHGAIFPVPFEKPNRFSWYQVVIQATSLARKFKRIGHKLKGRLSLNEFDHLSSEWNALDGQYAATLQSFRYLGSWIPQLTEQWANDHNPLPVQIVKVIFEQQKRSATKEGRQALVLLREVLRPHRRLKRDFLPATLTPGTLRVPVLTDIKDPAFIAEVEGAVDTFWNQSHWARSQLVKFKIDWKKAPIDALFAQGKINLEQHLENLGKYDSRAIPRMTTGGLTTFVRNFSLVFGPGKITPRTIAHEFGHLLGFSDCYLRTLTSQGVFGLGILEWDNPFYPDDLMCDNSYGIARVEVW